MVSGKVIESAIPQGVYDAEFVRCEEDEGEYGPFWRWVWRIHTAGALFGLEATRGTKATITTRNSTGHFCEMFAGKPIKQLLGADITPSDWYGTGCTITVKATENGSRVESFIVTKPPENPPAEKMPPSPPATPESGAVQLQRPLSELEKARALVDDHARRQAAAQANAAEDAANDTDVPF